MIGVEFHSTLSEYLLEYLLLKKSQIEGLRMLRVRDSQRSKVYLWESRNICTKQRQDIRLHSLSLEEIEEVVSLVWVTEGLDGVIPRPKCKISCKAHRSAAYCVLNEVRFVRANFTTVIHELAHIIASQKAALQKTTIAGHGPEFVRQYITLASHYLRVHSSSALEQSARDLKIKVAPWYSVYGEFMEKGNR